MLKIFGIIVGTILLLPIAIVLVALVCVTLIGGYVMVVMQLFGWLIAIVVAVILVVYLVKRFWP